MKLSDKPYRFNETERGRTLFFKKDIRKGQFYFKLGGSVGVNMDIFNEAKRRKTQWIEFQYINNHGVSKTYVQPLQKWIDKGVPVDNPKGLADLQFHLLKKDWGEEVKKRKDGTFLYLDSHAQIVEKKLTGVEKL